MTQTRVAVLIYVDLDSVPGTFYSQESAQNVLRAILNQHFSRYCPMVSLAPDDLQPARSNNSRVRKTFVVYMDKDGVPGTFHSVQSIEASISGILENRISHYRPAVVLAPNSLSESRVVL
jgi:hypothetical protein